MNSSGVVCPPSGFNSRRKTFPRASDHGRDFLHPKRRSRNKKVLPVASPSSSSSCCFLLAVCPLILIHRGPRPAGDPVWKFLLLNPIMSAEEVAKAFIQHFYQGFDANVESLASLFVSTVVVSVVACLSVCLPTSSTILLFARFFLFVACC